jgi:3-oxoacyl-[acyl-carrier protein] reductase
MTLFQNPFDRARETALVTGAGNGIGRAVAQALVGEGVRTVFADLSEERVRAAIATSPRPELAVPWVGDLGQREACDALLAQARSVLGQVTHLVHSASPPRPIMRLPSIRRPGGRCTRSISMRGFISRVNWRVR